MTTLERIGMSLKDFIQAFIADVLDGGDVIPCFKMLAADLFELE